MKIRKQYREDTSCYPVGSARPSLKVWIKRRLLLGYYLPGL